MGDIYGDLDVTNPGLVYKMMTDSAKGELDFTKYSSEFVTIFTDFLSIVDTANQQWGIVDNTVYYSGKAMVQVKAGGKALLKRMSNLARNIYLADMIDSPLMKYYTPPPAPSPLVSTYTPQPANPPLAKSPSISGPRINPSARAEALNTVIKEQTKAAETAGEIAMKEAQTAKGANTVNEIGKAAGGATKSVGKALSSASKKAGVLGLAYGAMQVWKSYEEACKASPAEFDEKKSQFKKLFGGWLGSVTVYIGTEVGTAAIAGGSVGGHYGALIAALVGLAVSILDIGFVLIFDFSLGDLLYAGAEYVEEGLHIASKASYDFLDKLDRKTYRAFKKFLRNIDTSTIEMAIETQEYRRKNRSTGESEAFLHTWF